MIFWEINNIFQKSIFQNTSSAQKLQNLIQDFFSKCVQIRSFLRIWSQSLQKSFMENFIFLQCWCIWIFLITRHEFRTQSNIWDEAFIGK